LLRLVMPAQAGIQGREGGWIPACAGMTEQKVVIDAQIIAARVFSKELTKDTKGSDNLYSELRALRVLRGENYFNINQENPA